MSENFTLYRRRQWTTASGAYLTFERSTLAGARYAFVAMMNMRRNGKRVLPSGRRG